MSFDRESRHVARVTVSYIGETIPNLRLFARIFVKSIRYVISIVFSVTVIINQTRVLISSYRVIKKNLASRIGSVLRCIFRFCPPK